MIRVEIATDYNAFNAWHCSSDHVMDVRQELSNSDFSFLNILCGLDLSITMSNKTALQMHRINTDLLTSNLKPRKREAPGRIHAVHRLPRFCPMRLLLDIWIESQPAACPIRFGTVLELERAICLRRLSEQIKS